MAHCSCLTVCIGVLATVSGQQMMQFSGSTFSICMLATVSEEQMWN